MNSSKYWLKRETRQKELLYDKTLLEYQQELSKQYVYSMEQVKKDIVALYDEIVASSYDGTLLASDLYKYNRYFSLVKSLNKQLKALGQKEIKITDKKLLDMYQKTSVAVGQSLGFSGEFNQKQAKEVINAVWCADGKNWSTRIWQNKAKLQVGLEKGLIDCISRGASKDQLVMQLMNDFNVGYRQADRLARTELSYVQNQATLDKYKQAGIKKYQVLSANDDRTCDRCKQMNGKIFSIEDAVVGETIPPFHSNDRCAILAIIE